MILILLNMGYVKRGHKMDTQRNMSRFSFMDFKNPSSAHASPELLDNECSYTLEVVVMGLLNENAPIKKDYVRANGGDFTTLRSYVKKACIENSFTISITIVEMSKA